MDKITRSDTSVLDSTHSALSDKHRSRALSIGIFFDGSGNNAYNTMKRMDIYNKHTHDESCLSETINGARPGDISRSSYDKYYTNIYRLFTLYKSFRDDQAESQTGLYISGTGTHSGDADSISGFAIGEGKSGIIAKTDEAIAALSAELKKIIRQDKEKGQITRLAFDLFGFSRGAASARHFANRVAGQDPRLTAAIVEGLKEQGDRALPAIETRFIGLFDGVAGIANMTNAFDPHSPHDGGLKLSLPPGIAHRVFQIAAAHEYRYNFCLQSIAPEYPELVLPGAHSDIGGGYNPQEEEHQFLSQPEFTYLPAETPDEMADVVRQANENMRILQGNPALKPLLNSGEMKVESWHDEWLPPSQEGLARKRVGAAVVFRRRLSNDWAKLALRVMVDAAQDAGVMLANIDEDDPEFSLPPELAPLCEFAREQGKRLRNGSSPQPFSLDDLRIAGRYLHFSASWCAVQEAFVWRDGGWLTTVSRSVRREALISYPDRPDENWMRTIYPSSTP
ncbi:T6SS phospholipase effector Tle1-like catalytic domain-containing protein [Pantoea coffeiphila]|uniref:Protein Hcp n=1 Tax=Pantoea coffeiphila TaxID=1465635 RepID=A0A2S9IA26_9GAMM|nr:DUF2235 domain-containing protein [Pantoea coffeiphila]PRD14638.1 protein Hcp [Pantoea coffeiphila]